MGEDASLVVNSYDRRYEWVGTKRMVLTWEIEGELTNEQ